MGTTQVGTHIGYNLVKQQIITESQLEEAMALLESESEVSSRRLGQVLYQDLGLERDLIMKAIVDTYAIEEVYEGQARVESDEIERIELLDIPQEIIDDLVCLKALPVNIDRDLLTVAAADPTDPEVIKKIESFNFRNYKLVYCRYELLEDILEQVYEQKNDFLDLLEDIDYDEPDFQADGNEQVEEEEIEAEINQSRLNHLIEGMLVEAVRNGVSDIHLVPSGIKTTDIRFRIDGKLEMWHQQKNVKPEAIAAVVKDKTRNVDRFERDASQDGFIQRQVDNHSIRYRVSIMPMVGKEFDRKFESVVIRVLDDRKVITDLNVLGLQEKAKKDFVKAIEKPSGIVIITGPTGSGKSTTLVAGLSFVIDPSVNVLTVEEPVEYLIEGARQLKLSKNMTFDNAMRGILRHDPDIVLVGEIRDLITAEIAIKLANTGHLTFSTLHTNDAPSAISRLYKMGVEPFLIANSVNLIMAQRLVRKLCEHCKQQYDPHPEMAKGVGFTDEEIENTIFYKPVGCDQCTHGYSGRTAIMEALSFDSEIRKMILESGNEIDEAAIKKYAVSQGMLSLRASGRERIKSGTTTIEEVAAITIEDEGGNDKSIVNQSVIADNTNNNDNQNQDELSDQLHKFISLLEKKQLSSNMAGETGGNVTVELLQGTNGAHQREGSLPFEANKDEQKKKTAYQPLHINNNVNQQLGEGSNQHHKIITMNKEQDKGSNNRSEKNDKPELSNGVNGHHEHNQSQFSSNDGKVEKPLNGKSSIKKNGVNQQQGDSPEHSEKNSFLNEEQGKSRSKRLEKNDGNVAAEFSSPLNGSRQQNGLSEVKNETDIANEQMKYFRYFTENPPKFLANFPEKDIVEFLHCGMFEHYTKDEIILQPQGYINSAYLVVGGEVAVWQDNIQLALLSKGSCICENFLFSKNTRFTKVISANESNLLKFERHAVLNFFKKNPEELFEIFSKNIIQHNNIN